MEILKTILINIATGLIGVLIGAWINNVFTWKIKNKVEVLDSINKDFALLNISIRLHSKELVDELIKQLKQTNINLMLGAQIIDREKIPEIYKYGNKIIEEAINKLRNNELPELENFGEFCMYIKKERENITSFCYMLKECNPLKIMCTK